MTALAPPIRTHQLLADFRMKDISYALVDLLPGQQLQQAQGVAGYFYHVLEGEVRARARDEPMVSGERGDTVLVGGFVAHEVEATGARGARLLVGAEPREHLAWLPVVRRLRSLHVRDGHPLIRPLNLTMQLVMMEIGDPKREPDQLTLERAGEIILFYFIRMSGPGTPTLDELPWSDSRLHHVVRALQDKPSHPWTLDQMAEIACMSRSAFSAHFREQFDESPMRLLTRLRLRQGAQRILRGEGIGRAALSVGYQSEEAFCRAFSREFGITPGRWRRQQGQSEPLQEAI